MADPVGAALTDDRPSNVVPGGDGPPPVTLRLLSGLWGRFGGSPRWEKLMTLARVRAVGRAWARMAVISKARRLPDDITVLIGVRNRTDHRIVNALRSVRDQVYPHGRVAALVVDYGSDAPEASRLADTCARFGAEYLRVDGASVWSRGRCLNIGLRHVRTKYVLTSDSDIVFSTNYLADAVATVRAYPLSVVCSAMLDLPEESEEVLRRAGTDEDALDVEAWRPRCLPRLGVDLHPSVTVTLTAFHHVLRGYDEFYEGWGREDDDLMLRFLSLGLRSTAIPERSFYLHQWHPKFEGLTDQERARVVDRNIAHFDANNSILRNDGDWGRKLATRA